MRLPSTYSTPTTTPRIIFYVYIKIMSGLPRPNETNISRDQMISTFTITGNDGEENSHYHAVADSLISGLFFHTKNLPPQPAIYSKLRDILETYKQHPERLEGLAPTEERQALVVDGLFKNDGQFVDTDASLMDVILLAGLLNTNLLCFTERKSTDGHYSYTRQPLVSMKNNENEYTVCILRRMTGDVTHFDALIPKPLIMTPVDPYGKFTLPFLEAHGVTIGNVPRIDKTAFEEIFPRLESIFNGICALDSHRVVNYGNLPEQVVYIKETRNFKLLSKTLNWKISPFSYDQLENAVNHPGVATDDALLGALSGVLHPTAPCEFAEVRQFKLTGNANTEDATHNFRWLMAMVNPMFGSLQADTQVDDEVKNELREITNLAKVIKGNKINIEASRIDVYMLGATVLLLMQECYIYAVKPSTYDNINWFYLEVFKLCKGMLAYDPVDRLSSFDANLKYTEILNGFE